MNRWGICFSEFMRQSAQKKDQIGSIFLSITQKKENVTNIFCEFPGEMLVIHFRISK